MIIRYNYLLLQVIKRTYIEGSLLLQLVKIFNIYKVTFLHFFNFTDGASFSLPNNFISILIRNTEDLSYLLVLTTELTVRRPGPLLMVQSSVGIT